MTTQLMRDLHAQPPPFEMDLVDADRMVGWVVDQAIGFRGFEDETEATHAAWVAHRTLARRLARTHGTRLVPIDIEPLALKRNDRGDGEVILASNRPIASLIRPGGHSRVGDSFGFELAVPAPTSEFQLRGLAYLIYRALRKSGVRWAIWRPGAPTRAVQTSEATGAVASRDRDAAQQPRRSARFGNRSGPTRRALWGTSSTIELVAPVALVATAFVMTLALIMAAPLTVTVPLVTVLGTGLVASTLVAAGNGWLALRRRRAEQATIATAARHAGRCDRIETSR